MIRLTRYNQELVVVNVDVIAFVEATPDTMVTLLNGDRLHVRESVDEVIERAVGYHRRIGSGNLATPSPETEPDA